MPGKPPLDLVILWHMHQPDYRDRASGEFRLPWVYLHAIKDYTDMASHLERHDRMRAVVNFTPVLLEQIEDYADQFATGRLRDPLLRLLARTENTPLGSYERTQALQRCFEANQARMIDPFPAYRDLQDFRDFLKERGDDILSYLSDRYIYDLVTWYHLAWTGETVRRSSETVARLMSKGADFTEHERLELFQVLGELVAGLVGRYRKLAADGRVELSTTPDHHPLAPLLIDLHSAREAMPAAPLPKSREYPGGTARVAEHLRLALESHERRFGARPTGVWPAEGAVSTPLLNLLGGQGCRWAATGENVLANSLPPERKNEPANRHRPYRLSSTATAPVVFFRDDHLSDLIGFEYAKWNGDDAARNFVGQLEEIRKREPHPARRRVVSIILDGENCWEYYGYNGYYFLDALYEALEDHATVKPTTFHEVVQRPDLHPAPLDRLVAGSWVYGTFSTWIGSADKNRAWDLLCAAKQAYDHVVASGRLDAGRVEAARRQLAACEASDWFWWFGDYNPSEAVANFDKLYRAALANLYALLQLPAPASLSQPVSRGGGHPESGGTMRRGSEAVHGD